MRHIVIGLAFIISSAVATSAHATEAAWMLNTYYPCETVDPASDEVFIYTNPNFGGSCQALHIGLYPYAGPTPFFMNTINNGYFGLPNDSISSLKVGSGVRARLFTNGIYGGNYFWFGGWGNYASMPSGWNDVTSSIRVEDNSRSVTCDDLQPGEFALFRETNFGGDCMVLPYEALDLIRTSFVNASLFGIANDSVSSISAGPYFISPDRPCGIVGNQETHAEAWIMLHSDPNLKGSTYTTKSGFSKSFLSGFDNVASSLEILWQCTIQ